MKKIRHTLKQIAETKLSEVYANDQKTIDLLFPYGDMKKVCRKCGRYQKICIC